MPRRRNPAPASGNPPEAGPITIEALAPAPYNPRSMTPAARAALEQSLNEFGDIAGITFNRRTGHLVTGHQRMTALRAAYGDDLRIEGEQLITPAGDTYRIRIVDWDARREKAANVAANSPYLSANFDDAGLHALLSELEADAPTLMCELRLDELLADVAPPPEPPENSEPAEFSRNGHSSVTYSGPEGKINEIKRLVSEKRNQIAEESGRAPREVPATEALHALLTTPAPASNRRRRS